MGIEDDRLWEQEGDRGMKQRKREEFEVIERKSDFDVSIRI
jgi:hypothetical protein